jgi:hypothetical protein
VAIPFHGHPTVAMERDAAWQLEAWFEVRPAPRGSRVVRYLGAKRFATGRRGSGTPCPLSSVHCPLSRIICRLSFARCPLSSTQYGTATFLLASPGTGPAWHLPRKPA